MKYVIANDEKAFEAGVPLLGHLVKGDSIILNEKEVMCNPALSGEFEDRVKSLDGTACTCTSVKQVISEGGWKHGGEL